MIQSLKKDIAKLSALVDGWDEGVNSLERELFLDLLRRMYEKVRFEECECQPTDVAPQMSVTETIAALATMSAAAPSEEREESDEEPECEVELVMEEGNVAIPVVDAGELDEDGELDFEVELVMNEDCQEPAEEECAAEEPAEPQVVVEPIAVAQPEPEPIEEPISAPEATPELTHVRPKISRQVIDTLYGDGALPKVVQSELVAPTPLPEPTPEPMEQASREQESEPQPQAQPSEPKPQIGVTPSVSAVAEPSVADVVVPKTVLGDVINTGAVRLGDSLQNDGMDVATKIAAGEVRTLRGAMGLNDKIMIIRDLFGGDAAQFEAVIDELDAQPSMDDALIYMSGYAWNSASDGAKMLMNLLKLKFS